MNSAHLKALGRLIVIDLVGSVVWFPVWWYTRGLLGVINAAKRALVYRIQSSAFRIWLKNFFVPMYGQYDITGRLMSVFMRFVVLVGRSIVLAVEAIIYAVGIGVWVLAPVVCLLLAILTLPHGPFAALT